MNRERIKGIFADALGITLDQVTESLTYDSIPEWDSFAHLDLIAVLEETYGTTFAVEEITELRSLGDAVRILERHGVALTQADT